MNELLFRKWLCNKEINKKVQSDFVSRLKRVEKEIGHCDIEKEYHNDRCKHLLSLFKNNGVNEEMSKIQNCSLPIGKYQMSTFRYAINKYIQFKDEDFNLIQK